MLVEQSNMILTAIIHGMRSNEPSNHVRLAATTALHNSLEFTRANFDKEASVLKMAFCSFMNYLICVKFTDLLIIFFYLV